MEQDSKHSQQNFPKSSKLLAAGIQTFLLLFKAFIYNNAFGFGSVMSGRWLGVSELVSADASLGHLWDRQYKLVGRGCIIGGLLTRDCFSSLQGELPWCLLTGPDDNRKDLGGCKQPGPLAEDSDDVPPRRISSPSGDAFFVETRSNEGLVTSSDRASL